MISMFFEGGKLVPHAVLTFCHNGSLNSNEMSSTLTIMTIWLSDIMIIWLLCIIVLLSGSTLRLHRLPKLPIKWTGFTKYNHLMSCIRYANALHAVIIFIGTGIYWVQQIHGIWQITEAWIGLNLNILSLTCILLALW